MAWALKISYFTSATYIEPLTATKPSGLFNPSIRVQALGTPVVLTIAVIYRRSKAKVSQCYQNQVFTYGKKAAEKGG